MLKGERVILRAIERDDLPRLHELRQQVDLITLQNGAWYPLSLARHEHDFEKHFDDQEPSWFVIEVAGVVIGTIGLHRAERRDGTAALGVGILDPEYLGKGYGREAIALLLRWGFRNQNYRRIWLDTSANNERAIRSYRAVGFIEEGRLRQHYYHDGEYVDAVFMGIMRDEWQARNRTDERIA